MLPAGARSPVKRPHSPFLDLEGEERRASVSSRSDFVPPFLLALEDNTQPTTSLSRPDSGSEDRVSPLSLENKTQETSGLDDKKRRPSFKTSEFFSSDSAKESKVPNNTNPPLRTFFDGGKDSPSPASPRQSSVLASSSPGADKMNKDRFKFRLSPRLQNLRRSSRSDRSDRSENHSSVPSGTLSTKS